MQINYRSKKDMNAFTVERKGIQKWGIVIAKKIRIRIKELEAATSLKQVSHLPPPRCHSLQGDLAGKYAVDVSSNKRLVFEPTQDPQRLPNGGDDLESITEITILEVTDYHGD